MTPSHRAVSRPGERGAGSMLALLLALLVLVAVAGVGLVGMGIATMHRARGAADLAALAGAQALLRAGSACRDAAVVAERNGAELVACSVVGDRVEVRVAVRPGWRMPLLPDLLTADAAAEQVR